MPISIYASGTRTAGTPPEAGYTALGTSPNTNAGVYQFFIDVSNLANGDTLEIQVLEKAISGGTQRVIYNATIANAQAEPLWVSPSIILYYGWGLQIKQSSGTARSFDWSIRRVST